MNEQLIEQLKQMGLHLGANGLPYPFPIHPNLVHFTLALPMIAITFDIVANLFPFDRPIFKYFKLPTLRSSLYSVGWYNIVVGAAITFVTVAFGFFEILLAEPPADTLSDWGLGAGVTMVLHGVGGVILLGVFVAMATWRGLMRYRWRRGQSQEVQWSYLGAGLVLFGVLFLHGTLGAQLGSDFGIHNTAGNLLREGLDPNTVLQKRW
jgi:uncharacterized membrane protein